MTKLFGTDGIRGVANRYPLDCETALQVGRACAAFFGNPDGGRFLIGQDTRISGNMLVGALAAGICSMGKDVVIAGVIPTPGVAHLTVADGFDAGIMISASHNPFGDNGIKLFKGDGYKLSDEEEGRIEELIVHAASTAGQSRKIGKTGQILQMADAGQRYSRFVADLSSFGRGPWLEGMKLVIDGSNGAASKIAPLLFESLGATVKPIFCSPDGTNINDHCGSQHPEILSKTVVSEGAHAGLAFDGDADRLIAVDEKGAVLSGDQLIAICARNLKACGRLSGNKVVTTVMSNMGLGVALGEMGIEHLKTKVGDRYVMEKMRAVGAVVGGEDSGHMIFLDHHTTGDGMLAALQLLDAMRSSHQPLSDLAGVMAVFPQCLINVDVKSKPDIGTVGAVVDAIAAVEEKLGEKGRVLVRYSGTQAKCRVMVEGPTETETRQFCRDIADMVAKELGSCPA
ncbi:MAG: phosphoglucosamine mutase [Proteobacteria bacterium]|nr:MAG: phosphoglucosamine mutase [Pseudomonadota bacterium]PIE67689.1 MAG: phosphoglucosamine mutase [Deltaproteobacteria bacterium]